MIRWLKLRLCDLGRHNWTLCIHTKTYHHIQCDVCGADYKE